METLCHVWLRRLPGSILSVDSGSTRFQGNAKALTHCTRIPRLVALALRGVVRVAVLKRIVGEVAGGTAKGGASWIPDLAE